MATSRVDPTRSKTLRKNYQAAVFKRFRKIKGMVREAVENLDVLGIGANAPGQTRLQQQDVDLRKFQFATRQDKHDQFMDWLEGAEEENILDRVQGPRRSMFEDKHWSNKYVRKAYKKGVQQADVKLKAVGQSVPDESFGKIFNKPIHQSKLSMLYQRNFRQLKGITDAMDQQISRELTEGIARGINPRDMAENINDRIDKVGISRARTLARTETTHTHAEATLNRFEEQGVQKVAGKAEWMASADACKICLGLEGTTFSVEEARGRIPAHPNGRCTWVPATGVDLE